MQQIFDPEHALEQFEPVEEMPIDMEDELYPDHLIPEYEKELNHVWIREDRCG
jgi:hypothetical protein